MRNLKNLVYDYSIRARDLTVIAIMTPFLIKNHKEYNQFKKDSKIDDTFIIELKNGLKIKFRRQDIFIIDELIVRGEYLKYLNKDLKGKNIVDIGANIGCFSLQAAWSGAKVFSVEASTINYNLLCENIALNKLEDKITASHMAIWKENGQLTFNASSSNPGTGSLVYTTSKDSEVVQCKNMDTFINELPVPSIDILKIDIEGAEFEVLPVLSKSALDKIKIMVGEYHQNPDFPEHNFAKIKDLLKENFEVTKEGFSLFYAKAK